MYPSLLSSDSAAKLVLYCPANNQLHVLAGTFFILYDFIEHFKKDNPSFLPRPAFLELIDTIFGSQWPVSQLEKDAIIFQYTDWEHIDDGYLNQKMIGDVVGDFFFVCPCNYFAMQYAEHGNKVFYYYFNHVRSHPP